MALEREYFPDSWVLIKVTDEENVSHRVLAGFIEKPRHSDDWRISKAITNVSMDDGTYSFVCSSGSTYYCRSFQYNLNEDLYNIWRAVRSQKEDCVELLKDRHNWLEYKFFG